MSGTSLAERADLVHLQTDRGGVTTIQALQSRMQTILEVMANVLEVDKDYGKIPGTDKPTLFKPGAEKLMLTFQLAASEPSITDLSTSDEIRYRVHVPIVAADGRILAVGVGEASTAEEKYHWRRPVCDEEFDDTPTHLRREKWFKGRDNKPNWKGKQIRTVPSDLANTVLKMAHKRGFIHGTLLATGASSVFNQDLEDFTKELRDSIIEDDAEHKAKPSVKPPQRKSEAKTQSSAAADSVTADGVLVKCEKGKKFWSVRLKGDDRFFTAFDDAIGEQGVLLLEKPVRVTFVEKKAQDKTYYNVSAIVAAPAAAAPATDKPLVAGDIFGGSREPGGEG